MRDAEGRLASFGQHRGRRLRAGKQALVDEVLPQLLLRLEGDEVIGLWGDGAYSPKALALEIGFGGGEHLVAQALANSDVCFIGCEPYLNGVGELLKQLPDGKALPNLRLFQGDARDLIDRLPEACLDKVYILFPDPWPKTRHHKRRLIQQEFLALLARVMKPGAVLQLATDHVDYLSWMLEQLLASPYFTWTAKAAADWQTPPEGWVETKYQRKALAEGRGATFLRFMRR